MPQEWKPIYPEVLGNKYLISKSWVVLWPYSFNKLSKELNCNKDELIEDILWDCLLVDNASKYSMKLNEVKWYYRINLSLNKWEYVDYIKKYWSDWDNEWKKTWQVNKHLTTILADTFPEDIRNASEKGQFKYPHLRIIGDQWSRKIIHVSNLEWYDNIEDLHKG